MIKQLQKLPIIVIIASLMILPSEVLAQEWQLVWSDEFEEETLDDTKWSYELGTGSQHGLTGWGNNELQYYTDRVENVYIEEGKLHIVARAENYNGMNYTSGRLRTIDKGDWTFGRFEIRAKLPKGQGIWPAIWMLPSDNEYGGWAASGEIDIMEMVGHEPDVIHGTIHYGNNWPDNVYNGTSFTLDSGEFSDNFHTFILEWEDGEMRWYVDDVHFQTLNSWHTHGHEFPAPFDKRFHLLLNVAVGGNWPGNPNNTTQFPQIMIIDYVRVYERGEATTREESETPGSLKLYQNYPNPFNPATNISFDLDQSEQVQLMVYDIVGRRLGTLANGFYPSGSHTLNFNAGHLSSGIYFYQLKTSSNIITRKMVLMK